MYNNTAFDRVRAWSGHARGDGMWVVTGKKFGSETPKSDQGRSRYGQDRSRSGQI
jgi:hypothetical protein